MKSSKRPPRATSRLSDSIRSQLNSYALAAGAAGVGVLALSTPCEGEIVYTPAHDVVGARSNAVFHIDLNHDGISDFTFEHGYFFSNTSFNWGSNVAVVPYKRSDGNGILGHGGAFPLRAGAKIGPLGRFSSLLGTLAGGRGVGRSHSTEIYGLWANGGKGLSNRYVGLKFQIDGETHYGWARVSISKFRFSAVLTGYAYETIPNKPILAGETEGPEEGSDDEANPTTLNRPTLQPSASLGLLAMGSPALSIWRREESVGVTP